MSSVQGKSGLFLQLSIVRFLILEFLLLGFLRNSLYGLPNTLTVVPDGPDMVPARITAPLFVMRSVELAPVSAVSFCDVILIVGAVAAAVLVRITMSLPPGVACEKHTARPAPRRPQPAVKVTGR